MHTRARAQTCTRASVKFRMSVREKFRSECEGNRLCIRRVPRAHAHTGKTILPVQAKLRDLTHRMCPRNIRGKESALQDKLAKYVPLFAGYYTFCEALVFLHICE